VLVPATSLGAQLAGDGPAPTPVALLPDLDPDAPGKPSAIVATDGTGRILLTFGVTIRNNGAGPLILRGHRASTAEVDMVADQEIVLSDGTFTTTPAVSTLTYAFARWGLNGYQTYELRQASDSSLLGTGPELGFCVEDNSNPSPALLGEPLAKVYKGCGANKPSALSVTHGISVGWANKHSAGRPGQLIDITTLPAGRYMLVHLVNPFGLLTEASSANNASSVLFSITWVTGQTLPTVRTIRSCGATATCS
jgi:hypothetical protein